MKTMLQPMYSHALTEGIIFNLDLSNLINGVPVDKSTTTFLSFLAYFRLKTYRKWLELIQNFDFTQI